MNSLIRPFTEHTVCIGLSGKSVSFEGKLKCSWLKFSHRIIKLSRCHMVQHISPMKILFYQKFSGFKAENCFPWFFISTKQLQFFFFKLRAFFENRHKKNLENARSAPRIGEFVIKQSPPTQLREREIYLHFSVE